MSFCHIYFNGYPSCHPWEPDGGMLPWQSGIIVGAIHEGENILLHRGIEPVLLRGQLTTTPPCYLIISNCKFNRYFNPTTKVQGWHWTYSPSKSLNKTLFLCPTTPHDLAISTYMIPTILSFSAPWTSNFCSGPRLISPTYGSTRTLFPDLSPLTKIAHTFGSSVHLRPDLAHTHASFASIAPDTQKLTHSPGRQGNTRD